MLLDLNQIPDILLSWTNVCVLYTKSISLNDALSKRLSNPPL